MDWNNFYTHYDTLIEQWLNDKEREKIIKTDPYFVAQRCRPSNDIYRLSDERLEIPEPYFGNPKECSAVIINLNPGKSGNKPERDKHYNTLAGKLANTKYSCYAKDFPCLEECHPGYNFWKQKNNWIKRLCNLNDENTLKPFAVELCPYHSRKWDGSIIDDKVIEYIKEWVIQPALDAVKSSKLPFALAIGKPCYDVLTGNQLGFCEKKRWTPEDNVCGWPKNGKGNVKRYYVLLGRSDGLKVLCTWCKGGNSAPAQYFTTVEALISKYIQEDKC